MTKLRSVACAMIAAVSTISTMKVERPRARLSDAPTRLNSRSTRPKVARGRGNVRARLREQGDQGVLAEEGRLAAHIRAGHQPQPAVLRQPAIIGDEALAAQPQRVLDHRVAAALDLEAIVLDEMRAGTSRPAPTRSASAAATSSRASASAALAIASARPKAAAISSSRCAASAASACAPAWPTRSACSCRSGALKRTTPARVWRWVKPDSAAISPSACRAGTSI